MAIPEKVDYLIIGAGIHGLSTAWHLAEKLKAKGKGDGSKILVIDKSGIASGASGVACGVVIVASFNSMSVVDEESVVTHLVK